jgi:selT/selW/selH-like putative selenoprotein
LRRELQIESELVPGGAGVFDVVADGAPIFSKHEEGRFPEDDEILGALRDQTRP